MGRSGSRKRRDIVGLSSNRSIDTDVLSVGIFTLGGMKLAYASIVLLVLSIAGCDAWFWRRIDVTPRENTSFTVDSSSNAVLIDAIRKFAAELGLSCPESNQFPFECSKQPTHVWAMLTEEGVAVCFYATGAPFESTKFEKQMARLENILASAFGAESITSQSAQCPVTVPAAQPSAPGDAQKAARP